MAKSKKPVWAIDIGNTSLKALQCRISDEPGKIEALAFDYIEHSKILSQPGAEPAELIAESLQIFLSRNNIAKNRIAVSVSGQNTISRFLKLPPVDKKKLPDIIQLEAKQWLPFALDDVVWDYQPLIGGSMHGNTLVDSEIGMFAMKREFAARAIMPFETAGIPVDCLQSSPLALYNFAAFDQFDLTQLQGDEEGGGTKGLNNYTIILCLGTDSSDVVITNGIKIWVRNITIGGNNFTKALTKGMKLTFSNAEHLKRNAASSQDPKAVFQVMRPVFNELLTEVNRSIEFYSSLDRKARYTKVLAMGSPTKLPGLCQFLKQNLGYDVIPLKKYAHLVNEDVIGAAAFADNANSFGICYGLALQMLGESAIATNLIPTEVVTQRLIANKKPWILAGAASLMLGFVVPFLSIASAYAPLQAPAMISAANAATTVDGKSGSLKSECDAVVASFKSIDEIGSTLTGNVEGRLLWPELYFALQQALPQNQQGALINGPLDWQDRIYVTNIEVQKVADLATWWELVKQQTPGTYVADAIELPPAGESATGTEGSSDTASTTTTATTATTSGGEDAAGGDLESSRINEVIAPSGEGYIIQFSIHHLHNPVADLKDENGNVIRPVTINDYGPAYVRRTLFRNLRHNIISLPKPLSEQSYAANEPPKLDTVTMKEFGFSHPILLAYNRYNEVTIIDPDALDKAVNEAILRDRTRILKAGAVGNQRARGSAARAGQGGMDMTAFSSDALSTSMGNAGIGSYMGETNPILEMAKSQSGGGNTGQPGTGGGATVVLNMIDNLRDDQKLSVRKFEAVVQLVWVPKSPTEREQAKQELLKAQQEAEAAAAGMSGEEQQEQTPEDSGMIDDETVGDISTESQPVEPQPTEPATVVTPPEETATEPETPPEPTAEE